MIAGTYICLAIVLVWCFQLPCVAETRFENAIPGRVLTFPRDHGKHPAFQTEWWYFTGNLSSKDGTDWGFQLTFFRRGLDPSPRRKRSTWAVKDLYPAHFAVANLKRRTFFHSELLTREGPGLAEASMTGLDVRVKHWHARAEGEDIHIHASADSYGLDLTLTPSKPLVLHGDKGFSRKGKRSDQASYYYSFTRLAARGSLTEKGVRHSVTGYAWMDHEFGSSIVREDQAGWDWFSIQLDDGTEIMVFSMRRKDGKPEKMFGTFVPKQGTSVDLAGKHVTIVPVGSWTSPHTGAVYPSGWKLTISELDIDIRIVPAMKDQELVSKKSTGIVYWEGAVRAEGTRRGKNVQGRGYVELTGYAHSMAGRL